MNTRRGGADEEFEDPLTEEPVFSDLGITVVLGRPESRVLVPGLVRYLSTVVFICLICKSVSLY